MEATRAHLAFGPSELSVAISNRATPAVRLLAEVTDRQPPSATRIAAAIAVARSTADQLDLPADAGARQADLFGRLVETIYGEPGSQTGQPDFRLGLAVEWSAGRPPGIKGYFDLYAAGPAQAPAKLAGALALLGLRERLPGILGAYGSRDGAPPVGRGLGVDFADASNPNVRLYLAGRQFSLGDLRDLLTGLGLQSCGPQLEAFRHWMLRGRQDDVALESMLVSPVISLLGERTVLKLDVALPRHFPDDTAAAAAVAGLARELALDDGVVASVLLEMHDGALAGATQSVLQYCSADLIGSGERRIGIYARPLGAATPFLSPLVIPRPKPRPLADIDGAIRRALGFLESECRAGFPEGTHRMSFPDPASLTGALRMHRGDVFAPALVGNALWEAWAAGFALDWDGLLRLVDRLVARRSTDVAGGWRYFPTLAELPPDADDLAEMLRLLGRLRPGEAWPLCRRPVELALELDTSGAFETWVFDRTEGSPERALFEGPITRMWGRASDAEVMANLVDAVSERDEEDEFNEALRRGVDHLVARQAPDGEWASTWYVGSLYGTYSVARCLARLRPGHPALIAADRFLRACINADGGWGQPQSAPLDTALGMLAGLALRGSVGFAPSLLRRAAIRLAEWQWSTGQWPAGSLIRMDTARAKGGGQGPRYATHGSQTLTTAFCLRALVAARDDLTDD